MSIACLNLLPSINVQSVNVGSNDPSASGLYSSITQSNDLISGQQVPNAVWSSGVGVSTGGPLGNALEISCQLNASASAPLPVMVLAGSQGSQVGNGSAVEITGDLIVAGALINSNSSSGKTGGEVQAYQGFFTDVVDGSFYVQDATNRVMTIWINISGKVANSGTTSNTAIIEIPNNPNDNVYIPPVSDDYIDGQGGTNFINFIMSIQSNNGNDIAGGLAILLQGTSSCIINFIPSYQWTADEALVIQGTVSYPY
jgi:hypothetical protein